ncbi:hypothetical protein N7492_008372 [Penicillium capsulatum]|uniref:Uncharacterized protein n=1 Tax=Penicillium capsulatum TaxID=69766 RepID=A0A9W9HV52_9EURO|nr:hypothetical protein N7492_008372 [Penicillium capsulatum]KAJ6105774.1 hypothetical protein N7512_009291 [Penicillium capsulatum]
MAGQDLPQQTSPTAPADESFQGAQSILNTTPMDNVAATGENPGTGVSVHDPTPSKPAGETKPLTSPSANGPSASNLAATEPEAPSEAQKAVSESKSEAHMGQKRDLDTATTSAPAPGDVDKPVPEQVDQPDPKKQKNEQVPVNDANRPAPAAATAETNGASKKAGRPKKEKVKEAVKKAIPTDGIGSRTRSRTKLT